MVVFRPVEAFALLSVTVFARFLLGGMANSRWARVGYNVTGAATLLATIVSMWSFVFLVNDLQYDLPPAY